MNEAASYLMNVQDFTSFAKRNSDVNNHRCTLTDSNWSINADQQLVYHVAANRFLRGMVRGLVGTQLLLGRGRITMDELIAIIDAKNCMRADFSAPAHGLFLSKVVYPSHVFELN
jgi:tRNA pseudouridine38-40 synthase